MNTPFDPDPLRHSREPRLLAVQTSSNPDPLQRPKTATPRLPVTGEDVDAASERLSRVARLTPVQQVERLTEIAGVPVLVKREDQQVVRSFKLRGAYNRMAQLSEGERQVGVVCASAGNHAQGVAMACAELGIHGTIYLPSSTPRQKRQRIVTIGGPWVTLEFVDGTFDDTQLVALQAAKSSGRTYIHPYDDPAVIAGQGSVAKEISEQVGTSLRTVVIPLGGGGLVAGMAAWLRENRPEVRIVGVESEGAASMTAAIDQGAPIALASIDPFVDGTAVGRAGDVTYKIVRDLVDQIVVVPEGAVCTEMLDLYHLDGIIAEPAGALATTAISMAATGSLPELELDGITVGVLSGGNNDLSRYDEVQERSQVYRNLRHYFLVSFPQRPGALREFLDSVLGPEDDILYFEYTKKNNRETGPALVGIDVASEESLDALRERMLLSDLQIAELDPDSELLRFLV